MDEGTQNCLDCPRSVLDYVTFEGDFHVISYYWSFYSYEGLCLRAKETVELMGSRPAFVYGAREGDAGSKCAANADGSLSCDSEDFSQYYEGCDERPAAPVQFGASGGAGDPDCGGSLCELHSSEMEFAEAGSTPLCPLGRLWESGGPAIPD